jgi:hypothetical protein
MFARLIGLNYVVGGVLILLVLHQEAGDVSSSSFDTWFFLVGAILAALALLLVAGGIRWTLYGKSSIYDREFHVVSLSIAALIVVDAFACVVSAKLMSTHFALRLFQFSIPILFGIAGAIIWRTLQARRRKLTSA